MLVIAAAVVGGALTVLGVLVGVSLDRERTRRQRRQLRFEQARADLVRETAVRRAHGRG